MNTNDFYSEISDYVCRKVPFKFFDKYYWIYTGKLPNFNQNHKLWVDYLLDSYNKYKSAGYTPYERELCSLMDGLDALVNSEYNGVGKEKDEDDE